MLKDINFEIPEQSMIDIMMGIVKPEDITVISSMDKNTRIAEGVYLVNDLNFENVLEANNIKIKDSYWSPRSEAIQEFKKQGNDTFDWDVISDITEKVAINYGIDLDFSSYGVCDNYEQILKAMPYLETNKNHHIITMCPIHKKDQPEWGGWRWHKWGEYIGEHEIKHEYLYNRRRN